MQEEIANCVSHLLHKQGRMIARGCMASLQQHVFLALHLCWLEYCPIPRLTLHACSLSVLGRMHTVDEMICGVAAVYSIVQQPVSLYRAAYIAANCSLCWAQVLHASEASSCSS
jgi:hypothetical protein